MTVSVLTLVRGRREQLVNLLHGLASQTLPPDELVIAYMQPRPHQGLPKVPFPICTRYVEGDPMPLARARNQAAAAARYEKLIFLDVDCIPSPTLVESYRQALDDEDGLYLGEVLYLPAGSIDSGPLDYTRLDRLGQVHPARPQIPDSGTRAEPDPGSLWGLSFALSRESYHRAGGMDEAYRGYGGEETDFAWRLARTGLPFFWVAKARAYHQHHRLFAPPYQHFKHILLNARHFHRQWGRWCMEYWLGQFRDAGLIDWHENAARIEILRYPTQEEIAMAELPPTALYC
ncbi:glycosyltransferase family 2 protein [Halomonas sp. GXIMD04776]|uniref:glycosyltransferase family 2 protein n=1 Tax=Halomonas sp. GXIMD04776 TaxID=3415605 RepID=UPI003C94E56A